MAKTTVNAAVGAGLTRAGGVHGAGDLGIQMSGRSIMAQTGANVSKATTTASKDLAGAPGTKVIWYGDDVLKKIGKNMRKRLYLASELVRKQTQRNLSKSVLKYKGINSKRTQVLPESRSKPGEFPRAETSNLRRDIFNEVISDTQAVVGTRLDYGLILETKMNRSFLRRTLQETQSQVTRILTKGM